MARSVPGRCDNWCVTQPATAGKLTLDHRSKDRLFPASCSGRAGTAHSSFCSCRPRWVDVKSEDFPPPIAKLPTAMMTATQTMRSFCVPSGGRMDPQVGQSSLLGQVRNALPSRRSRRTAGRLAFGDAAYPHCLDWLVDLSGSKTPCT